MAGLRGALALVAAAGLIVGCSDDGLSDVSGTVTYDGKPVEDGQIKFAPADGQGPTAGDVIKDGKYHARKVPVGTAKVTISGAKVIGQKKVYNTAESPVMPVTAELLPAKYNDKSELTFEVKRGKNEKNWELAK
jgi:hypothetical protein